jgi:hypothetical protein
MLMGEEGGQREEESRRARRLRMSKPPRLLVLALPLPYDDNQRGKLLDIAKLDVVCSRITMHLTSSVPPPKAPREPEDVLSREVPQETCEPHDGESESDPEDRLEVTRLDGRSESSDRKCCEPRTSVSSRGDSGKGTYPVDCS